MNYVNSIGLKAYHSVFNITVRLVLVKILYPKRVQETWMRRRAQVLLFFIISFVEGSWGDVLSSLPTLQATGAELCPVSSR
ncbi:MAG: hypothetical protein QW379_04320 [Thermoplasmata archaeon]